MADGTTKPIEDIEIGDKVKASDVETDDTQSRAVTLTIKREGSKRLVTLTVDTDGRTGDKTSTITATDGHPFWLPDMGRWVEAGDLERGQWLSTGSGSWVQITAVKARTAEATVHNLSVEGLHTYYVLADSKPILVHNTSPTPPTPAGVVYLRTDLLSGEEYVGQAKSWSRYLKRQGEHAKDYPGKSFVFEVLGRANPGQDLDVLEESWMRAGGGKKSVPGSVLENTRVQMNDARYKAAGGTVC